MRPSDTSLSQFPKAPAKMKDDKVEVYEPLLEVYFGTKEDPKPIFISALSQEHVKKEFIELLTTYKDYFAWDYHKLLGLDKELAEHYLPIKPNFKSY